MANFSFFGRTFVLLSAILISSFFLQSPLIVLTTFNERGNNRRERDRPPCLLGLVPLNQRAQGRLLALGNILIFQQGVIEMEAQKE